MREEQGQIQTGEMEKKRRRRRSVPPEDPELEAMWKQDLQYNVYLNYFRAKTFEARASLEISRVMRGEHRRYIV